MKKYIKAIFLLIVAIIPLILPSISIQIEAYEGEDALTAYAYELRLVRYEKQGDTPEYVGGRILIYNPEIFADIKAVSLGGGGDIPQSYDDFYSRSFSSISYIDASSNDNIFTASINGDKSNIFHKFCSIKILYNKMDRKLQHGQPKTRHRKRIQYR